MTHPSEMTQQIMRQLYELARHDSFLGRARRRQDAVALLQKIADQESLEALPPVVAHLFSRSDEVRATARNTVGQLLSHATSEELLHLTDVIGWSWGWYISDKWDKLAPKEVGRLAEDESTRCSVLGLISFHRNGYVRHEAVKFLSGIHDGHELPYLLIRQNDWVRQISADARGAIQERLTDQYLPHFFRHLGLAVHLLHFSRYDHSSVVKHVVEALVQPKFDVTLKGAISSPNRMLRREVVRIALDFAGGELKRVVAYGLASGDPVIRLHCAKAIRQCFLGDDLKRCIDMIKDDPFMPVRRQGILAETQSFPDRASQVWQAALLDSNSSIRDLARFNLSKLGPLDAADFYRRAIVRNPNTLAALQGLAETGNESDLPVFRQHLSDFQPRWRRAAVKGLAAVGKEAAMKELLQCLHDKSPSVVRTVCQQLGTPLDSSANEPLFAILADDERQKVRAAVLRLISSTGKWEGLPWLIRASIHHDSDTAAIAQLLVRDWFHNNKVFTKPTDVQQEALQRAWNESEQMMSEPFKKEVHGWLDGR